MRVINKREGEKMATITSKSTGIKIKNHIGTWYVIDWKFDKGRYLFLVESERFGDSAANIIISGTGKVIMEDVWNGFEELKY